MRSFWPWATFGFGLATVAVLIGFSVLPAVRAAYPAGDFPAAMSDFQRAETGQDIARIFSGPARDLRIGAMQSANTLDLFVFIPVYTLFLVAAGAMLGGGAKRPLAWLAIAPVLIGAGGDILETMAQLAVTSDIAHASLSLPIAPFYWVKYFALAFGALGVSAICLFGQRQRFILAALGLTPLAAILALWFKLGAPPLLTTAFGAFWVALIVAAFMEARAKDASL